MIDHVEEVRPELQLFAFHDPEILEYRRIDVHLVSRGDGVAACIAKSAKRRIGKRSLVDPVAGILIRGNQRYPGHYIRTRVASAAVAQIAPADRPRGTGIECLDALQLPSANQEIGQAAHSASEPLSFAEGNFVTQAVHEAVPDIKIGSSLFPLGMDRIARAAATGGPERSLGGLVDRLAERVCGQKAQVVRKSLLDLGLQRMVVRAVAGAPVSEVAQVAQG